MGLRVPMLPVDAAPTRRIGLAAALVGLLASVCACGDNEPARVPVVSGPPEWCAARDNLPSEGTAALIRARSPCWLRLSIREPDGSLLRGDRRRLASGAQVRVTWTARVQPGGEARSITPDDKAAGRSEAHNVVLDYAFDDGLVHVHSLHGLTRPGKGQSLHADELPPAGFQPLSFDRPTTLCTMAIADWAAGKAVLRRGRVLGREGADPLDRAQVAQLVLEIER